MSVPTACPAKSPCGSCPYRRDVPSGVWAEEEYAKLPPYDAKSTGDQPAAAFFCHQQDGRLCAGWVATHDMAENLGLRLLAATGAVAGDEIDAILDYQTDVPLFASGREAAAHGLAEVEAPAGPAVRTIQKLERKRRRA